MLRMHSLRMTAVGLGLTQALCLLRSRVAVPEQKTDTPLGTSVGGSSDLPPARVRTQPEELSLRVPDRPSPGGVTAVPPLFTLIFHCNG